VSAIHLRQEIASLAECSQGRRYGSRFAYRSFAPGACERSKTRSKQSKRGGSEGGPHEACEIPVSKENSHGDFQIREIPILSCGR
jgi:hypothetical protein